MPFRTIARMAAFIPGASPPLVKTAIRFKLFTSLRILKTLYLYFQVMFYQITTHFNTFLCRNLLKMTKVYILVIDNNQNRHFKIKLDLPTSNSSDLATSSE